MQRNLFKHRDGDATTTTTISTGTGNTRATTDHGLKLEVDKALSRDNRWLGICVVAIFCEAQLLSESLHRLLSLIDRIMRDKQPRSPSSLASHASHLPRTAIVSSRSYTTINLNIIP
jgi:hypothetical protein